MLYKKVINEDQPSESLCEKKIKLICTYLLEINGLSDLDAPIRRKITTRLLGHGLVPKLTYWNMSRWQMTSWTTNGYISALIRLEWQNVCKKTRNFLQKKLRLYSERLYPISWETTCLSLTWFNWVISRQVMSWKKQGVLHAMSAFHCANAWRQLASGRIVIALTVNCNCALKRFWLQQQQEVQQIAAKLGLECFREVTFLQRCRWQCYYFFQTNARRYSGDT